MGDIKSMTTKNKTNILIIGNYNQKNWGDNLFDYVFKSYIFNNPKYHLIFKDISELSAGTDSYNMIDKVVIGGGDIVNDCLFDATNMKILRDKFTSVPIYFVGVDIPHSDSFLCLDIGDYFFIRNNTDFQAVKYRFSDKYTNSIPDLGFAISDEPNLKDYQNPLILDKSTIKRIGVCLSNTITYSETMLSDICQMIIQMSKLYEVHIIPFDVSGRPDACDVDLISRVKKQTEEFSLNEFGDQVIFYMIPPREHSGYERISVQGMIEYFKNMDVVIASRFHSVILSVLTEKPFVSIYSSRKINSFKIDHPEISHLFVEVEKDLGNVLENVNVTLNYVFDNYNEILTKLRKIREKSVKDVNNQCLKLRALIDTDKSGEIYRQAPPQYITAEAKRNIIESTIKSVLRKIFVKISLRDIDSILSGTPMIRVIPNQKSNNLDTFKKIISEEILWSITGDCFGPYYYGLYDNVLNNHLLEQLDWIITDYYQHYYYKQVYSKKNVTLVNKNFQKIHRSGWQFIVDNIVLELNNNDGFDKPMIIDTYIDKTFHWNKDFYSKKGIIPYKQNWIGFIHHTYSDYNNNFNCSELFKDAIFTESLKTCKCLIVMTDYLKSQVIDSLNDLNDKSDYDYQVEIVNLTHPTEYSDVLFDWDCFMANENRQLVQVGNWLRNVFSIYELALPDSCVVKSKSILRNKNADNYFAPEGFLNWLYNDLNKEMKTVIIGNEIVPCRNAFINMHIKGLYDCIVNMESSVSEIGFLDNQAYDDLLSKNIVFLNLVDASACNTLLECIMRNTPVLVNPIPPVVEMLGKNYPLYYNSLYEASKLLENPDAIRKAYEYLAKIEKFAFNIDQFMKNLKETIYKYI